MTNKTKDRLKGAAALAIAITATAFFLVAPTAKAAWHIYSFPPLPPIPIWTSDPPATNTPPRNPPPTSPNQS